MCVTHMIQSFEFRFQQWLSSEIDQTDGSRDQMRAVGSKKRTVGLKDAENLVSSDSAGLSDAVRVTEDNTDLRGGQTLLGERADLLDSLIGGGASPGRSSTLPGQSTSGDSLSVAVDTTHTVFYCYSRQIQTVSTIDRQNRKV